MNPWLPAEIHGLSAIKRPRGRWAVRRFQFLQLSTAEPALIARASGRGIRTLAIDLAVLELAFIASAIFPGVDALSTGSALYPFAYVMVCSARFAVPVSKFRGFIAAALVGATEIWRQVILAAVGQGRSGQREQRRKNGKSHFKKTGHTAMACPVCLFPQSALLSHRHGHRHRHRHPSLSRCSAPYRSA